MSVMTKCWDVISYPNLTATDVVKDLTVFEQGFSEQYLSICLLSKLLLLNRTVTFYEHGP